MLIRMIRIIATIAALLSVYLTAQQAVAEITEVPPKPGANYVLRCIETTNTCIWVLKSNIHNPQNKKIANDEGGKQKKPVCQFGGAAQICLDKDLGNWSNGQQCYMQREDPQPPKSDPRWKGRTDGSIWACVREQGYDGGRHLVTRWVWLPGPPDTVVTDPITLVYEAIASMQLQPPQLQTAPDTTQTGIVNMPVWLWVTPTENTYGPITRGADVPGLAVTAQAEVTALTWTMGDGSTIRCQGPGSPYSPAYKTQPSPTCGHRYLKTSREQPTCRYDVTARADWTVTWRSTLGDTGQISMTRQAATQLRIGEAVPVLVAPDNDGDRGPAAPAATAQDHPC